MIQLKSIYVQYGDRKLIDRASFNIKSKDKVGLVGRNGAGKSTLLKIIAGEIIPHEGNIQMPTGTTIGFLHQDIFIPEEKTILQEALTAFEETLRMQARLDQIHTELEQRTDYESDAYTQLIEEMSDISERFLLMDGQTAEAKAQLILKGLGFKTEDMNRPIKEFSGGWKMRVELAKILLRQPDYMLLDEPTNHLDIESILWLEDFLTNYPGSVIIISHDKTFLDQVTTKTIEIELGKVYEYSASYSGFLQLRAERRALLQAQVNNQQKLISEKEKLIDRFRAKANKAKMAQSLIKELKRMDRIEMESEDVATMRIRFLPAPRIGAVVFKAQSLSKAFGDLQVLTDVDLMIERNETIAFVGQNGQGKTTLSKIIMHLLPASSGEISYGHNIEPGYYAQDQADSLDPDLTVLETMEHAARTETHTQIRSILGAFMFSGDDVEKKVKVLSGGERARLALAKLLLRPINLLILDEPTNHLDILSKEVLKQALKNFDGTMIIVSHDRDFLQGLTDRTIEFRDQKLYNYIGDVYAFLEKRQVDNMRQVEQSTPSNASSKSKATPSDRQQQKLIKKWETKIMRLEEKIKNLEVEMAVVGFYDQPEAQQTLDRYHTWQKELEDAYDQWSSIES